MNIVDIIAQDVFDKVRSRFSNLEMGTADGGVTASPTEARFFDFDFGVEGNTLGRVSISINEPGTLKIFYGQSILSDADPIASECWYDFLKNMRMFAKRRMLRFDTRDITKSNLNKTDFKYLAKQGTKEDNMSESRMFGSSMSSYLPLERTRLIVRHTKPVDENQQGGRSRNIKSLYIENQEGERFKYPYAHLAGAKAMQRHVANGGRPYDDHGKAIIEMSENIAKLGAFKRLVGKHDSMNMEANDVMEKSCMKLESLRQQIHNLAKQGHYEAWKESFVPVAISEVSMDQATMETYKSKFTVNSFKEDLTQYFPLIDSIMREASTLDLEDVVGSDTTIEESHGEVAYEDEFSAFESWASSMYEGRLTADVVSNLKELLANDLTLGVDAVNAIESLQGIGLDDQDLNDALIQLAKVNPEADPSTIISAWLQKHDPDAANELDLKPAAPEESTEESMECEGEDCGCLDKQAKSSNSKEIAEMVKSFYDRETGKFPLGPTAVLTKVRKEYGDRAADLAEQLVSHLERQNQSTQEMQDIVRLSGTKHSALDKVAQRAQSRNSSM